MREKVTRGKRKVSATNLEVANLRKYNAKLELIAREVEKVLYAYDRDGDYLKFQVAMKGLQDVFRENKPWNGDKKD